MAKEIFVGDHYRILIKDPSRNGGVSVAIEEKYEWRDTIEWITQTADDRPNVLSWEADRAESVQDSPDYVRAVRLAAQYAKPGTSETEIVIKPSSNQAQWPSAVRPSELKAPTTRSFYGDPAFE